MRKKTEKGFIGKLSLQYILDNLDLQNFESYHY
jgi:hypothetical protein